MESHPAGSAFHTSEWLEALRLTYDYEPVVFTTSPPGLLLTDGVVACRVRSRFTGQRLVSVPFADHCQPLAGNAESLRGLTASLCDLIQQAGYKYVELRPGCGAESGMDSRLTPSAGFWIHTLDLSHDLQELFCNFHKTCVQNKIRRAEREQLHYQRGRSEMLMRQFYSLLIRTRRRHGIPPQPLLWFRNLARYFGDSFQIRMAYKNGVPVASILTLSFKRTLLYKYGCSDERYARYGGTALLFWKAIQEAKADGLSVLDFGRSDLDDIGLVTFKDRWGTTKSMTSYWRYPWQDAAAETWPRRFSRHIVGHLPNGMLVALGRLLYRHFA